MSDVFGIDLGTTYSAIAYINEHGLPEVIRVNEGFETTPSVVYFENATNYVVGQTAKNGAVLEPDRTISLIKRQMGMDYRVSYDGAEHTPESISALILKDLVAGAREATGVDSNKVVITVPAYFGVRERLATQQAGEIAGLEVVGIVTEPVAAALAYGANKQEEKTLFVYDLGGGTFDTTVMQITPTKIRVLAIDGHRRLGGADWDARLIEHMANQFREAASLQDDPLEDDDFRQVLTSRAEEVKQALSRRDSQSVPLRSGPAQAKIEVTRADFERITSDLLASTIEKVDATLAAAKEKVPDLVIDEVLLVGGSSYMPAVRQALESKYGWAPRLIDPNLAVAKGAAIYGQQQEAWADASEGGDDQTLQPGESRALPSGQPEIDITNVLPKGLGVLFLRQQTNTEYVGFLAHKNQDLPLDRLHQPASTATANATSIQVRIFEQGGEEESENPADNIEVTPKEGAVFNGLPNLPEGSPIDIYLTIDREGLATLEAFEPKSGQRLNLQVSMSVMQADRKAQATEVISGMTSS